MTDLQTATYIIVIVGMSLIILTIITLAITALVVKHKISEAERKLKQKANLMKHAPTIGVEVFKAIMKHRNA